MEKEKMSEKRNAEWIASVEERLRWFLEEATDEEFDAEEVDALVSLLNKLKPLESVEIQSDEEALAKFHEYAKLRDAEESTDSDVWEREAVRKGAIPKKQKRHNRLRHFVKNHKIVSAAAAIILVILVAGGSMGAVNANKGNGFFYWLQKDDEGMTMLTSPESMDGEMLVEGTQDYFFAEEVPEEYQTYVVNKEKIPQLKDYELVYITVTPANTCCRILQCFKSESEGRVYIGAMIYEDDMRLERESHLSESVQAIDNDKGIEEGILLRENVSGVKEGRIFFYSGNIKYFVDGDMDIEILIQIAEAYRNNVLS